jgi:hypothetical protein
MDWRSLSILSLRSKTLSLPVLLLVAGGVCSFQSTAQNMNTAGKTIMAKGQVQASQAQQQRLLVRRDPVFSTDLVSTGEQSASQLRMIDGALLTMQASSELNIANYEFDPQTTQGSVQMSLLKGGLRTVTGALQQRQGNYKLLTPVASIGVRGTHYEAELVEGDLYLAGWKGIIDVTVNVANKGQTFSLGPSVAYRFAIVRANGDVEFVLQSPVVFDSGYANALLESAAPSEQDSDFNALTMAARPLPNLDVIGLLENDSEDVTLKGRQRLLGNEFFAANWLPDSASSSLRQGTATFDRVEQQSLRSAAGAISDFNMSMTVNFDSARIPSGNVSFVDSSGEWFAAFDGVVGQDALQLSVNFASHANNLAQGSIEALLIDQAKGVLGTISLAEVNNPAQAASGGFLLRQSQP